MCKPEIAHRIENPSMNRLKAVPYVRKSTPNNYAHRIIDVAGLHFIFDGRGNDFFVHRVHVYIFICCHVIPLVTLSLRGGRRPTKQSTSFEIASTLPGTLSRNDSRTIYPNSGLTSRS